MAGGIGLCFWPVGAVQGNAAGSAHSPRRLGVDARERCRAVGSAATKAIIPQMVPYAIVGVAYLALRFSVLGRISWKHPFMARVPDSAIWMTVPYVFVNYLQHLIAPFHLSLIYGTSFITSAADPRFLLPVVLLLGLGCVLWIYRQKAGRASMGRPGLDLCAYFAGA